MDWVIKNQERVEKDEMIAILRGGFSKKDGTLPKKRGEKRDKKAL